MHRILSLVLPASTSRKTFSTFVEHMVRGWLFLLLAPYFAVILFDIVCDVFAPQCRWHGLETSDFMLYYPPALGAVWTTVFFLRKPVRDDGGA